MSQLPPAPPQPDAQSVPPTPPPKKKRWPLILLAVLGLILLISVVSCVAITADRAIDRTNNAPVKAPPSSSPSATWIYEAPEETATEDTTGGDYTPNKSDWVLKIKTTDKQCFGSAGCNVTVRVTPQYAGPGGVSSLPDEGTLEITYKLTGDESGPITGTSTVELADKTVNGEEESLSTRSSGTKVKAAVTDVEYNEYG